MSRLDGTAMSPAEEIILGIMLISFVLGIASKKSSRIGGYTCLAIFLTGGVYSIIHQFLTTDPPVDDWAVQQRGLDFLSSLLLYAYPAITLGLGASIRKINSLIWRVIP